MVRIKYVVGETPAEIESLVNAASAQLDEDGFDVLSIEVVTQPEGSAASFATFLVYEEYDDDDDD